MSIFHRIFVHFKCTNAHFVDHISRIFSAHKFDLYSATLKPSSSSMAWPLNANITSKVNVGMCATKHISYATICRRGVEGRGRPAFSSDCMVAIDSLKDPREPQSIEIQQEHVTSMRNAKRSCL